MSSTTTDILLLTFGSFGILLALTSLGEFLRAKQGTDNNPVLETYMTRVQSWWGMVAFVGIALISGKIGVIQLSAAPITIAKPTPQIIPSSVFGERFGAILVRPILRPKKYSNKSPN